VDDAKKLVEAVLNNGRAWEMFLAMIRAQGGDVATVEDPTRLPRAVLIKDILSPKNGYVQAINAQLIGETVMGLGGGRTRKGEKIDYGVGIVVHAKVGDYLTKGDPLISIHANSESELEMAKQNALQAIKWSTGPVDRLPLFYGLIDQGMGLTGINQ
jgi:pyrimidine-nucleoside phosphorylase